MPEIKLSSDMIESLKSTARRQLWTENEEGEFNEDFNPGDFSGGNFDDAYAGGVADGETETARQILTELGIEWN